MEIDYKKEILKFIDNFQEEERVIELLVGLQIQTRKKLAIELYTNNVFHKLNHLSIPIKELDKYIQ